MSERITITIETGTAAFRGDPAFGINYSRREIARILRRVADEFQGDGEVSAPRDINSGLCGSVKIESM